MSAEKPSLMCGNCGVKQAILLMFFEKIHHESGRISQIDPVILCKSCHESNTLNLYELRPHTYTFQKLAEPGNEKLISYLVAKKRKNLESNQLSVPFWRKKLWHARYVTVGDNKKKAE